MSDDETPPSQRADRSRAMQFAAMGIELAGMTIACMGIGYLADWHFGAETLYGSAFGGVDRIQLRHVSIHSKGNLALR